MSRVRPELFRAPLTFEAALAHVLAHATGIARTDTIALAEAAGRVAASPVVAAADIPPFDRSAMDGYAVRSPAFADVAGSPLTLRCVDRIVAGDWPRRSIGDDECAEIATGAPLPPGADAVVMVEHTSRDGDLVMFRELVRAGQNVGRRGGDISIGRTVVDTGHIITPARAGALAALGVGYVTVVARPSVAIISTGSEVVSPADPVPAPGQIRDVNAVTLSAIVSAHGGTPVVLASVPDDIGALTQRLEAAAHHDLIVCSGGSSVGSKDLLTDALANCGRVVFHGIAVKPGKPTLFGFVGDTPLFGMPGNPTSCLSNAYLLLVPYLRAVAQLPRWRPLRMQARLGTRIASTAGRHQFYSVRIEGETVVPAFKSSGDITSMADADGYIEIPADVSVIEAGTPVTVTLF